MEAAELRALQKPVKDAYRDDPAKATVRKTVEGRFTADGITCTVDTWAGPTRAGLHPATGGDGSDACSADMLLQALAACAGVTLRSVATAMGIELRDAVISASGTWDARGTLGVDRSVPVGFTAIELSFELDTDAEPAKVDKLLELTERYCVIAQTLQAPPTVTVARG
ncbi:OsmC family protein [Nakamurella lactea]|uniref:OsmC family protein n=1 Tax=Nakamurella lactea TaxID=459515 RepID=UPI0003F59E43|nr:OsmC family protein [Nakamurella lactea]